MNKAKARKDDVDRLQADLDNLRLSSLKAYQALEGINSKLWAKIIELKVGIQKGKIEAYSAGF